MVILGLLALFLSRIAKFISVIWSKPLNYISPLLFHSLYLSISQNMYFRDPDCTDIAPVYHELRKHPEYAVTRIGPPRIESDSDNEPGPSASKVCWRIIEKNLVSWFISKAHVMQQLAKLPCPFKQYFSRISNLCMIPFRILFMKCLVAHKDCYRLM